MDYYKMRANEEVLDECEKNRKVMPLVSTHLYLFGLTFDNLFCFPKGWRKRFELRREMNAF